MQLGCWLFPFSFALETNSHGDIEDWCHVGEAGIFPGGWEREMGEEGRDEMQEVTLWAIECSLVVCVVRRFPSVERKAIPPFSYGFHHRVTGGFFERFC